MAQLKVHNSLKPGPPVLFEPIEEGKVSWYACGPTVYDHSHLGHARNYVSTDIIRRIMIHFFGYKVKFVMNITDVDDKIILRARRQKLLELEKSKTYSESSLSKLAAAAFQAYAKGNLPELLTSADGAELSPSNYVTRRDKVYGKVLAGGTLTGEGKAGDAEAKMKMHLSNLTAAATAIKEEKVFGGADEILLPYLDSLYKETVDAKDHKTWTDVTEYWEEQFMKDMDDLNVMRPDVITRVTAYVPQIATFVEKIVQKGFAYEADGSVYFDIAAFEKAGNPYARLRPESKNDKALQEEGEGSLGKSLGGKRGAGDFALWKKSKAGEPSWPSPWGEGRPGWHIECSVMASDVLGSQMDIHSGGVDLAFPHHDNELAQSEAYFCEHGHEHIWVKYFMHMGHLSIAGSKMSKSLKNFQTIRDALKTDYTARGMRIAFLLGRWNSGVEISDAMRQEAKNWESAVNNLFVNVKSHTLALDPEDRPDVPVEANQELRYALEKAREDMKIALSNSFDTPEAMKIIMRVVDAANKAMMAPTSELDLPALNGLVEWVTQMVRVFGLDAKATPPYAPTANGVASGWATDIKPFDPEDTADQPLAPYWDVYERVVGHVRKDLEWLTSPVIEELINDKAKQELTSKVSKKSVKGELPEAVAMPILRVISRIRDELRKIAPSEPNPANKKILLELSDRIRDEYLFNLGIYLDDGAAGDERGAFIKHVPMDQLLAERAEKEAREADAKARKEAAKLERERVEQEKAEKAKVPPTEMFRDEEKFSAWDGKGIPVRMKDGEEVTKSAAKRMAKEWERQKKVHEEWKAKSG